MFGPSRAAAAPVSTLDTTRQALSCAAATVMAALTDVPVFWSIGNHGAFPVNQYRGPPYDDWAYTAAAASWAGSTANATRPDRALASAV